MSRRAVFLDRDGVINNYVYNSEFGTVDSPNNPSEFTLADGAAEAVAEFNRLGLVVIVISNQPGIAKGKFSPALLEQVTQKMHAGIAGCGGRIDGVYYCLHHPQAIVPEYLVRCECRKPKPGMLLQAARDFAVDLRQSFMVGDGITDVEAGLAAGTRTIFVGQSKPYIHAEFEKHGIAPDFIAATLAASVPMIKAVVPVDSAMHSAPAGN